MLLLFLSNVLGRHLHPISDPSLREGRAGVKVKHHLASKPRKTKHNQSTMLVYLRELSVLDYLSVSWFYLTFSDFSFSITMLMLTDFYICSYPTNRFECWRMELNFVLHVKLGDWPWLYLGSSLIVLTWFIWVGVGSRREWE